MGKTLLFSMILLVSLGMALWLVGPLRHSTPKPQLAERVAIARSTKKSGLQPPPAISSKAERPVPAAEGPTESALSIAACPLGMVFVKAEDCEDEDSAGCGTSRKAIGSQASPERGFCIDRYEYPNLVGVMPATMVHFAEAKRACAAESKRLCRDREWTAACAGTPQGAEAGGANAERCNRGGPAVDFKGLDEPADVAAVLATRDGRVGSGQMADCVSSSGVFDLLGNVQEWVVSNNPSYEAGQKGGYFSGESATCGASRNSRQGQERLPSNGFRCCADPLVAVR